MIPGTSNSTFYAVAYTGTNDNRFVLAGSAGEIFVSSNNLATNILAWTPVASGLPTNNPPTLRGATVAANGPLQGIVMVVGDAGTILVGGTPPLPPISLGNQTNCATYPNPASFPPNPPLVVAVVPDADHPPGSVTVDWFDAQTNALPQYFGLTNIVTQDDQPLDANTPSNYVYYVRARDTRTGLTSSLTNLTKITLTINPRPTASLVTAQTICNGQSGLVQLQANLTGLSPWTVTWSDGVVQTTNAASGSGAVLIRGVPALAVTNLLANLATNFVFTVTSVTNADTCAGNQPGDLTCTNSVTVNPRPTASLVTAQTICNGQSGLVQLQANLTGLSPWTVTWSDGVVQTTNAASGSGAVLIRGVPALAVTNLLANLATNFVFTVTSVTNADTCAGNQPGDLTCTNSVTVNPRPTASLVTAQTICNGQSGLVQLQANLTGLSPWTVTWSDGVVQTTNAASGSGAVLIRGVPALAVTNLLANLATNFVFTVTSVTNADTCAGNQPGDLTCTNSVTVNPRPTASLVTAQAICNGQSGLVQLQANLTGLSPWTVTWSDGVVQTTNAASGSGAVLIRGVPALAVTNLLANLATNFVFTVTSVTNADTCAGNQPGDLTCTNTVTVNPLPLAPSEPLVMAGVATNSAGDILETNVLGGVVSLSVAIQANATVWWYDWTQTKLLTNNSLVYLPTNAVCGVYTNYVQAQNTNTGCFGNNYVKVILVLVPPAPASNGDQTNCAGVANPPLSVTVFTNFDNPTNLTANWYMNDGTLVTNHSLTYVPTDMAAGTYTYLVEAQDFASGLVSTNRTPVNLVLQACTNVLALAAQGQPGTNLVLNWFGNLYLLDATNLIPPIQWNYVTQGVPSMTNYWTNSVVPPPPMLFFRLSPTN